MSGRSERRSRFGQKKAAVGWSRQWHVSVEQARTGTHSYKCGDTGTGTYANLQDARLISPILTALPSDVVLEFWHTIDSEVSTASPDSAYDGGWLEDIREWRRHDDHSGGRLPPRLTRRSAGAQPVFWVSCPVNRATRAQSGSGRAF
ncbi:MAG: hypothetical protein IPH10_08570 [bacterium]|nr:hypothetical protein [bacterium]